MFTGIVEEIGEVISIERGARSARLSVQSGGIIFGDLKLGDSVAVNGVCLTVAGMSKNTFTADVMNETLSRSSLGSLRNGSKVNLERALAANARFGGHIVSGHIDGTGVVTSVRKDDNAILYHIKAGEKVMRYIIEKGSVAIDGISLTVTKVDGSGFAVSVIPHTASNTMLAQKSAGDTVNLENDIIGKYVEKLLRPAGAQDGKVTAKLLEEHGFC